MSKLKQLFKFSKTKEDEEDDPITVGELFKQVTECSPRNVTSLVSRSVPRLLHIVNKYRYTASTDLHRQLTLSLWTSLSLVSLVQVQSQEELDNFETEFLKRKVEREHERIINVIIVHYNNNDLFLQDYLAFISIAGIWNDPCVSNYLLGFIPTERVYVDEFVKNTCKVMVDEYWKRNKEVSQNISDIISFLILDKEWISTSYGSQLCIEYLLRVFESIYDDDKDESLTTADYLLRWMRYLVERMSQPEHISDLIEALCIWLYFHANNIHQVINMGSLIFLCCDLYHPLTIQLSLKHFFQNVVLCMINSNEMSVVSIGYDIIISITDRFDNRDILTNPKIYNVGELHQLKKPTRHSLGETLFSREDFIHMTDSIHKVVVNSIKRFINSKIVARKVNTLVSLLAIEGCDSAQGLTSVISFALSVQDAMLQMSKRYSVRHSIVSEDLMHPDYNSLLYHGSVASWFSLVCSVNYGDLDLFRSYVKSVIELRADSAPYLLPSQNTVPMLPCYIYEMDKSLYFDIDQIQGAIENSWVILTNNRELLNSIKIPRSSLLVEKYVDLQLLDSFNAFLGEDKLEKDYSDDQVSLPEFRIDEVNTLFTDVENRYSDAFTEPFDRFKFDQSDNISYY